MPEHTHELAGKLATSWINGNRDYVIEELCKLKGMVAVATAARMVLLLHNGHELPIDLALFTSRIESEAYES